MNPKVWGPKLWFSLHTITLNYPKKPTYKHKKIYNNFFINLQYILPCSSCAVNYKKHLDKYPIKENLDCRKDLVLWLIKIHNEVNKQLGKPTIKASEALKIISKEYKKEDTKCKIKNYNWTYIIIITILILISFIIIYMLFRKKRNSNYIQIGGRYNMSKIHKYYRNRY